MPGTLAEALRRLQANLPDIKKSETATVKPKDGKPPFSYTYADLGAVTDAIFPALAEVGLAFIAKPTMADGQFVLAYSLLHISGQREDGTYPLSSTGTPQAIGSAITYARRYCLCAVTGVAPEDDDDGAAASTEKPTRRSAARRTPAKPRAGGAPEDRMIRMFALMRERGITAREDALRFVSNVVGLEINSRNDLTPEQVEKVIDALQANPGFEEQP
jgi:ERF superfamily